jgi:hypothetical protein
VKYNAVQFVESKFTLRRNISPTSSGLKSKVPANEHKAGSKQTPTIHLLFSLREGQNFVASNGTRMQPYEQCIVCVIFRYGKEQLESNNGIQFSLRLAGGFRVHNFESCLIQNFPLC